MIKPLRKMLIVALFIPATCFVSCAIVYVATGANLLPTNESCATGGCGGRWLALLALATIGAIIGAVLRENDNAR